MGEKENEDGEKGVHRGYLPKSEKVIRDNDWPHEAIRAERDSRDKSLKKGRESRNGDKDNR